MHPILEKIELRIINELLRFSLRRYIKRQKQYRLSDDMITRALYAKISIAWMDQIED